MEVATERTEVTTVAEVAEVEAWKVQEMEGVRAAWETVTEVGMVPTSLRRAQLEGNMVPDTREVVDVADLVKAGAEEVVKAMVG
jgi:hypothetical protein